MLQGGYWRQYTLASFFGASPGCLGDFMNVSAGHPPHYGDQF
jgi:hypothetical protein